MSEVHSQRTVSIGAIAVVAGATGLLTWLCIGWFGAQTPLAAVVAVLLVELFLGCMGVIAMLLAARLSDTYMEWERRFPEQPPRPARLWLWRPIWQPTLRWDDPAEIAPVTLTPVGGWLQGVYDEMQPIDDVDEPPPTVPFPAPHPSSGSRHTVDPPGHRRAA